MIVNHYVTASFILTCPGFTTATIPLISLLTDFHSLHFVHDFWSQYITEKLEFLLGSYVLCNCFIVLEYCSWLIFAYPLWILDIDVSSCWDFVLEFSCVHYKKESLTGYSAILMTSSVKHFKQYTPRHYRSENYHFIFQRA